MQTAALNPFELLPPELLLCEVGARLDPLSFLRWRHTCVRLLGLRRCRDDEQPIVVGGSGDLGAMCRAWTAPPELSRAEWETQLALLCGAISADCLVSTNCTLRRWRWVEPAREHILPYVKSVPMLRRLEIAFLRFHLLRLDLSIIPQSDVGYHDWILVNYYNDLQFAEIANMLLFFHDRRKTLAFTRLFRLYPGAWTPNSTPLFLNKVVRGANIADHVLKSVAYTQRPDADWREVLACELHNH